MFKKWLDENKVEDFDFSVRLFPKASSREFWGPKLKTEHIENAEKYLGFEWPLIRASQYIEYQKSGNRLSQETPHFARRYALFTLFIGELSEHKGRFLPDLCDGIFAICEETFWGISAHKSPTAASQLIPSAEDHYIDLFAAETAELLAIIYHILYDEIKSYCPDLLERIEYELDRRIVSPYINRDDFWWMGNTPKKVNNWNPWIIANLLTVFLVSGQRPCVFESGLKKMLREINLYYDILPDDGGCDEGSNYWAKAGGKLFEFCDQLYIASGGKVNFFDNEKLRRIIHYVLKAYIGDCYFVNFSDGNSCISKTNLDYALYGFGLHSGDKTFCRFASTLKQKQNRTDTAYIPRGIGVKSELFSIIYADEIDSQSEFVPEDIYVLPDLQNTFVRAGDWFCATNGGHNDASHNHNDVGNVIVFHGTEPVIIDVGCGVYTKFTFSPKHRYKIWTMQSGFHSLPVLNGYEQLNGSDYRADHFAIDGKTTFVSFGEAYPKNAGISKATRAVSVTDDGVAIEDNFEFENDTNTADEHFITLLKPKKTHEGIVLGGKFILKTQLPCKIEWKDFEGDSKLKEAWGTDGIYRISLCSKGKKSVLFKTEIRSIK